LSSPPRDTTSIADDAPHRELRADARRNRERVLVAAREVFEAEGVGAHVTRIAERAGVGIGTVYRHFPTKEALIQAILVAQLEAVVDEARELAGSDDPGGALYGFLGRIASSTEASATLKEALAGTDFELHPDVKRGFEEAIATLLRRAQEAGAARTDVDAVQLLALVGGACSASRGQAGGRPLSSRLLVDVICDGLRSGPAAATTAV
jgi:AcrR family transcriptional regulator